MDRTKLKSSLVTLAKEKPEDFRSLVQEVLAETAQDVDPKHRQERLTELIKADFDAYDEVFKRLA